MRCPAAALLSGFRLIISVILCAATTDCTRGAEDLRAFDLVLEALRNHGRNQTLIWNGYLEFELSRTSTPLPDSVVEQRIAKRVAHLEKFILTLKTERERDFWRKSKQQLEQDGAAAAGSSEVVQSSNKLWIESHGLPWPAWQFRHEVGDLRKENSTGNTSWLSDKRYYGGDAIDYIHRNKTANVSKMAATPPVVHEFGRIRGQLADSLRGILLYQTDLQQGEFNSETVAGLKRQLQAGNQPYQIKGSQELAGGTCDIVEIGGGSLENQRRSFQSEFGGRAKVWVDAARGYICPRVEQYQGEKLVALYESSNYFLDEGSGLWFPEKHSESKFDPQTGKLTLRTDYNFNPQAVRFNQPISEGEFAIVLPPGSSVFERNTLKQYTASSMVTLKLSGGQIDLQAIPGLSKAAEYEVAEYPANPGRMAWIIGSTILAIGSTVGLLYIRRRKAARMIAIL